MTFNDAKWRRDQLTEEEYKYKTYASKAFKEINDAMFNFRHSMGIKTLTNKDTKLKKKVDAIHQAIFDLQREMKSTGLTEAKVKKGDAIQMQDGEYGVVNKVKGRVAYIKLDSMPGSFHPIEAARITYKGKHKGKDLYLEGKEINEMGTAWIGWTVGIIITMLIKWAKKNPKDVKELKDRVNKEL